MKVLHCITGLTPDGAQQMLLRLAQQCRLEKQDILVVSLSKPEPFAKAFEAIGVPVHFLSMRKGIPSIRSLRAFSASIKEFKPDVIQGWMYHANVYASLVSLVHQGVPVVWNIRRSMYEFSQLKLHTRLTIYLSRLLSRFVHTVIYCTQVSKEQHERFGFKSKHAAVIENGFAFPSDSTLTKLRSSLREELAIRPEQLTIGIVGRYDIAKDFPNFFTAAKAVLAHHPNAAFVCIGRGLEQSNEELMNLLNTLGIASAVHLLGQQENVCRLMAGMDVYCSASRSEGFPNTIAEALGCGVPCVVTDVGASATIVETNGVVVPAENADELASAIRSMLEMSVSERQALGQRGQASVRNRYSIAACANRYRAIYEQLVESSSTTSSKKQMLDATG